MANVLYRIRPLLWRVCNQSSIKTWVADTIFGEIRVQSDAYWFNDDHIRDFRKCKTLLEGKKKAERWYQDRVGVALDEVRTP